MNRKRGCRNRFYFFKYSGSFSRACAFFIVRKGVINHLVFFKLIWNFVYLKFVLLFVKLILVLSFVSLFKIFIKKRIFLVVFFFNHLKSWALYVIVKMEIIFVFLIFRYFYNRSSSIEVILAV